VKLPLSWLRDYVELPEVTPRDIADRLTAAGLQVERVNHVGEGIDGVVVARVVAIEELTEFKKPIRWVTLTDGTAERQVICGATNFAVEDLVAYARPPASLPGGLRIEARESYGHTSDGMICSGRELGISEDHTGILVLEPGLPLGTDVVSALGLRDDVLDLSINPDRGYALSVRGLAREVAIAYGAMFRDSALVSPQPGSGLIHEVRIEDPTGCDRYVARGLDGLDPSVATPPWMQRRLVLAGMRPISLMVDVTNYVMLDVGQPLHAFDRERLRGAIVVRRARPGERLRTLDDVDRELDPRDLVVADDTGPIALAGVMGGAATEITDTTTRVLLEAAHFEPTTVAYTARRHRLGSEASRRFERGVDDALPPSAAELALSLIEQFGAGRRIEGVTDVDHRPPIPAITLDPELPGRIAGVPYPQTTVEDRLTEIGCGVSASSAGFEVSPPSWRPDLKLPVDLVEEVVRLEGYDELPSTLPRAIAGEGLTRTQRLRRVLSRALAAAGYTEVLSSPFVDAGSGDRLLLDADDPRRPSVRIANPVSEAEPYLRTSLLPGLFAAVTRNIGRGLSDVALFESGPVFRSRGEPPAPTLSAGTRPSDDELAALDASLPQQPSRIAAVVTGMREPAGWWGPARPAGWPDAIEAARVLGRAVGLEVAVSADRHPPFHPGRCAALHVGDELLGHAGELHPRVIEAFDLPARTAAVEVSVDVLMAAAPDIVPAPVVSSFPAATIDVALVVDDAVPVGHVADALRVGAGSLLESLRMFDLYTGHQVGDGRKSVAFAMRLRAPDRTLTAEEVAAVRDAAVSEAARRHQAELRG
jgi:phenylalanyl-tRNA synthetase beta chain